DARRAADAHADVPFARLVDEVGPGDADPRPDPFASVALVVRRQPLLPGTLGGAALAPLPVRRPGIRYELRFVLEPQADGGLRGVLEYDTDLFDAATAERIAARFPLLLAAVTAAPDRPLSPPPLLTPDERTLVLAEWNATDADVTDDGCLHEAIAAQTRRAPDAPAVSCGT